MFETNPKTNWTPSDVTPGRQGEVTRCVSSITAKNYRPSGEVQGHCGDSIHQYCRSFISVFLADGIGITPFRSMIPHATEVGSADEIFLFYSIRRFEEGAFLNELQEIQELNHRFKFIPTITCPDGVPNHWRGEHGHITESMLNKWLPGSQASIFYIAGPRGTVDGMRQILCDAFVSEDDNRAEEFAGY